MAKAHKRFEIGNIPEVLTIIDQVIAEGEPRVLTRDGEELAVLTPSKISRPAKKPRRGSGILAKDDSLWNIVGRAESAGPTDVAEHKHEYLAEAYTDLHE